MWASTVWERISLPPQCISQVIFSYSNVYAAPANSNPQHFFTVYPELSSKLDKTFDFYLFSSLIFWLVSNILVAFTVYFNSSIIGILSVVFQLGLLVPLFYCLFRWMKMIAAKQHAPFIRFDRLTTDEYAAFSYVAPILLSTIAVLLYGLSSGELSWQSRSERGLLVHIAVIYTVHMTLIRKKISSSIEEYLSWTVFKLSKYSCAWAHSPHVRRDEDESPSIEANLLRLKQIFVRYVSHEIRYT